MRIGYVLQIGFGRPRIIPVVGVLKQASGLSETRVRDVFGNASQRAKTWRREGHAKIQGVNNGFGSDK